MRNRLGSFATLGDHLGADPVAPVGGTTAFDNVVRDVQALTSSAGSAYNIYSGRVPPVPVQPATNWNKILLYGGIGLVGLIFLMRRR